MMRFQPFTERDKQIQNELNSSLSVKIYMGVYREREKQTYILTAVFFSFYLIQINAGGEKLFQSLHGFFLIVC